MTRTSSLSPAARPPSWMFVLVLFLVAFALRFTLTLLLRDLEVGPVGPKHGDDVEFDDCAQALANGDGYFNHGRLTSFRAPGFPFLLAALYYVFGVDYALARVVLCLLGAANAVLAYFLARELVQEGYAKAVGILTAIYLGSLSVSLDFISENLFVPLLTLGCWLFVCFLSTGSWWTLPLTGLVLGYATLVRPFTVLLLPLWGLLLVWHFRRQPGRLILSGLVFGTLFLVPVLSWTWRNYQVHGHFVLVATNGGSTFYGGNNDVVYHTPRLWGFWVGTDTLPQRDRIEAAPNEYEHDQVEWQLGKEWIRANPGKAAGLVFLKLASACLRPPEFSIHGSPVYGLRIALYAPLLVLIGIGLLRCLANPDLRRPPWMTLHLALAASMATVVIFCGLARFRDANASLLMIYAVIGWDALRQRWFAPGGTA